MVKYVCKYCGKEGFSTEEECERHELEHELKEKLASVEQEGTIICPDCDGEGGSWGNDGCDWHTCNTCGGKGIVISKTRKITTTAYEKV